MNALDLTHLLRRWPFVPFRIFATDGRTFDVRHPDQLMVSLTRVVLPVPTEKEVPERLEHLGVEHIIRAEELSVGSSQSTNGQS